MGKEIEEPSSGEGMKNQTEQQQRTSMWGMGEKVIKLEQVLEVFL